MMMIMMPSYPSEEPQGPNGAVVDALPMWQEEDESGDHRQYMFHYHTMMCPQFADGYCPRHKGSRSATPQCFCYHFESQQRRPLVDTLNGQLRYWDIMCEHVTEGNCCPCGAACPFAHTREEISYHAAKYKTKLCNDRECRGQEVCCFAHGESELRTHALERYSYWSVFGGGPNGSPGGPQSMIPGNDPFAMSNGRNAANGATGALYHPKVYKHRFCASYPHVASCRRSDQCAFAHTRDEIRTPLLAHEEEDQLQTHLTNDFFMYKFKTLWCPVGVQHDWQTCVYAHNYQDARRHPGINYGPRPCPYWKRKETNLEYSQRCPLGVCCPYSHGAKEQLYHPAYFKTVTCQDWPNSNCPRGKLCAFWHKRTEQRSRPSADDDEFNYKLPIGDDKLRDSLQPDFLSPPFKLLNSMQDDPQAMPAIMEYAAAEHHCGLMDDSMHNGSYQTQGWPCNFAPMDNRSYQTQGSPQTPTTIADSDELASADSSSGTGTDKTPAGQEDDGSSGGAFILGQNPGMNQMYANVPWPQNNYSVQQPWANGNGCGNDNMQMVSFAQAPNGCGMGPQMMCYVQMPAPQMTQDMNSGTADGQAMQYIMVQAPMSPCGEPQNMLPLQTVGQGPVTNQGGGFGYNMVGCGDGNFNGQVMAPVCMDGGQVMAQQ